MDAEPARREWLEADGRGGFASGTVGLIRTRRYHALLLVATRPPADRFVLVNGLDAWIEVKDKRYALSSQRYTPDVVHPDGATRIESFTLDPWPTWTFGLTASARITYEIVALHDMPTVVLRWRLAGQLPGAQLRVRLLLSGRDPHALHHENPAFRFEPVLTPTGVRWRPYDGVPPIAARTTGSYRHDPQWYRNFSYLEEQARGLDHMEDLASPGTFAWSLEGDEATLVLSTDESFTGSPTTGLAREAVRRRQFTAPLERTADAYLVRRGAGRTVIAGYPWFGDWGRDTFIALRGLCLATGRLEDARRILIEWAGAVSAGMLPNRFPDRGETPEFNSVDASLWFVIAAEAYLATRGAADDDVRQLRAVIDAILGGYAAGTRHGIRLDTDGLLAAGEPGVQLTWMDAKVGDQVVTPRVGKPVEVQALWLNAIAIASAWSERWAEPLARGRRSFRDRFWNAAEGCLFDVIDVDHVPGRTDASFRPNQIFAVGGLPRSLFDGEQARWIVDAVEARLWTPLGLRSLAPGSPGYAPRYAGGVGARDGAYHQGTVWPWLIGPFVEAWVRVRGSTIAARNEARTRFLDPLLTALSVSGLGHLPEVADAEPPHRPGGCPFQAWSVAEALRLERSVLG